MQPKQAPNLGPSTLVRVLFRLFDAMSCGAILLDRDKRVLHASSRGERYLRESFSTQTGRLSAKHRPSDALFQTLLDQALKYGDSAVQRRRQAMGVRRHDRRPLIVRVVPVDPAIGAEADDAALVLMLLDPEECVEPSPAILQQVFGMTNAEARVANRILCGETLQQIADKSGVSVGTVRSQVKAVFAKTGTNRQSELVGLLTRTATISEDE